jgi:hypothetical protein
MALANHLAKIKSSGIYRFVWDKSVVPPQQAETLRLMIGYSDKGPFNTPVYIESVNDFTNIFGNISKRMEKKGIFFNRLCQQALGAGPILALNLKPFDLGKTEGDESNPETVSTLSWNGHTMGTVATKKVTEIYNQNRFWVINEDELPGKLNNLPKYFNIAMTDENKNSHTIFIRNTKPESYKDITLRQWYSSQNLEITENVEGILDTKLEKYFMEIYVFKGDIRQMATNGGILSKYFTDGTISTTLTNVFGEPTDALEALANDSNSNFVCSYTGCTLPYFKDANGNYISIDLKFNADFNTHKMLMKLNDDEIFTTSVNNAIMENDFISSPLYMQGYTYNSIKKDDDGIEIYNKVMDMLKNKGIHTALTNRVDIEYHYLVDTFGVNSNKVELFQLAKDKDNAFAIVNLPKMTDYMDVNELKNTFMIPDEGQGASYGGYFSQIVVTDGTVKTTIPSAAAVSNLFMNKWSVREPYYIVAGPTHGRLNVSGLVGPDYNFGRSDLDILEPMGINAIVYVPRLGTYISSNQTAKQIPVSGLSKIHIRELVIYLQNEIEALLQNYQWELNTQTLRNTIKSKADDICKRIQNNGGLYAFRNVIDETNNTPEVIDNEMIILDTEIEPARGAGKMVHQLTIHKTGGLTSTVK